MGKVIYIGNFSFPYGNAAGKRVYGNGKILSELGYDVIFIGLEKSISSKTLLEETENEFDGFKYYNLRYPANNKEWLKYNRVFDLFIQFISSRMELEAIDMIIYYGSPSISLFLYKLIKFAQSKNIKIISDCVDWLTVKTDNPVFDLFKWIDTTFQKVYLNNKADGVITISKFLDSYYKQSRLKTVIIPPLSVVNKNYVQINNYESKLIIYAGLPFRKGILVKNQDKLKDRIDKMIALLSKAKERGALFKFDVYGFTESEYLAVLPSQSEYLNILGNNIEFHGVKPNTEVTEVISGADFTFLIRDVNRDTTAGFPTKVSESISLGTPVITTRTSDLEDYLFDGVNAFFIDGDIESPRNLVNILSSSKESIFKMKSVCYNSNVFDYRLFKNKLASFIESVMMEEN